MEEDIKNYSPTVMFVGHPVFKIYTKKHIFTFINVLNKKTFCYSNKKPLEIGS